MVSWAFGWFNSFFPGHRKQRELLSIIKKAVLRNRKTRNLVCVRWNSDVTIELLSFFWRMKLFLLEKLSKKIFFCIFTVVDVVSKISRDWHALYWKQAWSWIKRSLQGDGFYIAVWPGRDWVLLYFETKFGASEAKICIQEIFKIKILLRKSLA